MATTNPVTLTRHIKPRPAQIQSLDRGLQLLEYLGQAREPLALAEMDGVLNVDRSTIHRLLATLVERGYVQQDSDSKRYSLGLKVVELSRASINRLPLRQIAHRHLKELVRLTSESANLGVLTNGQAVCVDHEASESALSVINEIGDRFVLHATSIGKALLAFLPVEERHALIETLELPVFTPRTITDANALRLHLQQIYQQGYALDDEERYIGVRCVAAPVYDHRAKVVAAISISGPSIRITYEKIPQFVELMRKTAQEISKDLGSPLD